MFRTWSGLEVTSTTNMYNDVRGRTLHQVDDGDPYGMAPILFPERGRRVHLKVTLKKTLVLILLVIVLTHQMKIKKYMFV